MAEQATYTLIIKDIVDNLCHYVSKYYDKDLVLRGMHNWLRHNIHTHPFFNDYEHCRATTVANHYATHARERLDLIVNEGMEGRDAEQIVGECAKYGAYMDVIDELNRRRDAGFANHSLALVKVIAYLKLNR